MELKLDEDIKEKPTLRDLIPNLLGFLQYYQIFSRLLTSDLIILNFKFLFLLLALNFILIPLIDNKESKYWGFFLLYNEEVYY